MGGKTTELRWSTWSIFDLVMDKEKRIGRKLYREARGIKKDEDHLVVEKKALVEALQNLHKEPLKEAAKKLNKHLEDEVKLLLKELLQEQFIELQRLKHLQRIGALVKEHITDEKQKTQIVTAFDKLTASIEKELTTQLRDLDDLRNNEQINTFKGNASQLLKEDSLSRDLFYNGRQQRKFINRVRNSEKKNETMLDKVSGLLTDEQRNSLIDLFKKEQKEESFAKLEIRDIFIELIYLLQYISKYKVLLEKAQSLGWSALFITDLEKQLSDLHQKIHNELDRAFKASRELLSVEERTEGAAK